MSNPPRTPAEFFSGIMRSLSLAVDAHQLGGWRAVPLMLPILLRLGAINQLFARLAARIMAGKYVPRRPAAAPRRQPYRQPRQPDPLPKQFGWLAELMPETRVFGLQLEYLFRDPAMAALMAAAPAALRRPLRSLCRMLGVTPPPILALPARKPIAPAPPAAMARTPQPLPAPPPPPRAAPAEAPVPHACGPPLPA